MNSTINKQEEPLTPLTITDGNKNIIARIPYNNHEIDIHTICDFILTKFARTLTEHEYMKGIVAGLQAELLEQKTEILDQKEAFEHADDSLQNLRIALTASKQIDS